MEDIRNQVKTVHSLVNEINAGKYNFDLPIQRRRGIWSRKETSLFIDSILRMYPIYPALLNKHSDTKILDVIDFKQRFTGVADYVNDKFPLSRGLKPIIIDGVEYEIAGKKFSKLDEVIAKQLTDRELNLIIMTNATEEEINDIFDRINMGHPLSNGCKRSTIESEEVRDIIFSLASNEFFSKFLTKAQFKRNVDRDTVIQILMLVESKYGYEITSFGNTDMNKFIIYYNNLMLDEQKNQATRNSISLIEQAISKLNIGLEDVEKINTIVLPLCVYSMYSVIKGHRSSEAYLRWFKDFLSGYGDNEEFARYCGSGTANAEKVKGRLNYFENAVRKM